VSKKKSLPVAAARVRRAKRVVPLDVIHLGLADARNLKSGKLERSAAFSGQPEKNETQPSGEIEARVKCASGALMPEGMRRFIFRGCDFAIRVAVACRASPPFLPIPGEGASDCRATGTTSILFTFEALPQLRALAACLFRRLRRKAPPCSADTYFSNFSPGSDFRPIPRLDSFRKRARFHRCFV